MFYHLHNSPQKHKKVTPNIFRPVFTHQIYTPNLNYTLMLLINKLKNKTLFKKIITKITIVDIELKD
jgi:hypothetical protein